MINSVNIQTVTDFTGGNWSSLVTVFLGGKSPLHERSSADGCDDSPVLGIVGSCNTPRFKIRI